MGCPQGTDPSRLHLHLPPQTPGRSEPGQPPQPQTCPSKAPRMGPCQEITTTPHNLPPPSPDSQLVRTGASWGAEPQVPQAACKPRPTRPQRCPPTPPSRSQVQRLLLCPRGSAKTRGKRPKRTKTQVLQTTSQGRGTDTGSPGERGGKTGGPWRGKPQGVPGSSGKGQLWGPRGDRQHAQGDRQRSPGYTGSRGGTATGPQGDRQHAWGDNGGPLEIGGP